MGANKNIKMKKITISLLGLLIVGCGLPPEKRYEVTMEIYYPNKVDTITRINTIHYYPRLDSNKGTNSVSGFYETSAPIKILKIKEVPLAHD